MSTLLDIKLCQVCMLNHIVDYDFFRVDELRFCDCFIHCCCILMRDLRDLRGEDEVKDFIVNSLMKQELRKEKIMVLLNKICIICCESSLYQFGYMDLILKDKIHYDCHIDIPFARLKNCDF